MGIFGSGLGSRFVGPLLRSLAEDQVRQKMVKAEPKIIDGMVSKGMQPALTSRNKCVRDAMFRLWKSVIASGDLSDAIRDYQDNQVVPAVLAQLSMSATLQELVAATREAVLKETFGGAE